MAVWSRILRPVALKLLQNGSSRAAWPKIEQARCMSEERIMIVRPSNYQWHKMKDWLHFYVLLGAIPIGIGLTLINVFIGPATLEEIPEGYTPKEWEYYDHPVKRFLQRYFFPFAQQEYEKYLHYIYTENEIMKVRRLESQVEEAMSNNYDYRSSTYFREIYGSKYLYKYRQNENTWNVQNE